MLKCFLGGIFAVVTAFAVATTGIADDSDKKKNEKAPNPGKGVSAFGKFLPLNRVNQGVTIPSFSGGVKTALVTADTMKRIDDDNLELEDMVIETYLPDGNIDSKVILQRAWFNMPSSVLVSRTRSKVERTDFQIEGDSLVFDTETQRGRMAGNVKMVIYDVKLFGKNQGLDLEKNPDGEKKDTDGG